MSGRSHSSDDAAVRLYGFWSRHSTRLLIAAALLAVGCATAGLLLKDGAPEPSALVLIDAALFSIALLALEGFTFLSGGDGLSNWLLRASQVFVILFIAIASGKILASVFQVRNSWRRRRVELCAHDLCIGSGWKGQQLINSDPGRPTIVVDIISDEARRERCDLTRSALVTCDATLPQNLAALRMEKTRRVFITCGSDELNLSVAAMLIEAARSKLSNALPTVVVALDNPESVTLLNALNATGGGKLDLRHFEARELTARMLFDTTLNEAAAKRFLDRITKPGVDVVQLILAGDGTMLEAILIKALQLCHFEQGLAFEVSLAVPDPADMAKRFAARFPCYTEAFKNGKWTLVAKDARWTQEAVLPTIVIDVLPTTARAQIGWCERQLSRENTVSTVIAAFDEEASSVTLAQNIATVLHRLSAQQDLALFVYANLREARLRDAIAATLASPSYATPPANTAKGTGGLQVFVFSDYLGQLTRDVASLEDIDFFALKINAGYYNLANAKDETIKDAWRRCTVEEKNSNRLAAHYLQVLYRAAKRLRHPQAGFESRKVLAQMEHRRWCAEYLLNGYEPLLTDDMTQETRAARREAWLDKNKPAFKAEKLHLSLVAWDDMAITLGEDRVSSERLKDYRPLVDYPNWLKAAQHAPSRR